MLATIVLALLTLQRLSELAINARNAKKLLARGGIERGARHYPFLIGLHACWLIGLWVLAWNLPVNLALLCLFIVLQLLRLWVIRTLGARWTTRIIVLPNAPLIKTGPYRFLRHPNYWIVAAEVAVLPLAFGLWIYALVFSVLNAVMLFVRIRVEDGALREFARRDSLSPLGSLADPSHFDPPGR